MKSRFTGLIAVWRDLGSASFLRIIGARLLGRKIVRLKLAGIRTPVYMRLRDSDIQVVRQVLAQRECDPTLERPPASIIDGGANVGYVSLFLANKYPDARILAVEPDEGNCEMFRRNLAGYDRVTLVRGAIWHRSAPITIENPHAPSWAFRMRVAEAGATTTVPGYTLLQLMDQLGVPRVDLLKLDIEGAELEVLSENSSPWIARVGVLIVELHELLRPGCTQALHAAIAQSPHVLGKSGEYTVVRFTS